MSGHDPQLPRLGLREGVQSAVGLTAVVLLIGTPLSVYMAAPPWKNGLVGIDVHNTVAISGLEAARRLLHPDRRRPFPRFF